MNIVNAKGGYMISKTINAKLHVLFITEEEAAEIASRYQYDFEG